MSGESRRWLAQGAWQRARSAAVDLAFIAAATALVYGVFFKEARVLPQIEAKAGAAEGARARREPPLPTEPISLNGMQLRGIESARVILIEYGDYQCPYCGRFARETQPALEEKFVRTGKVRLAYLHLPLPNHALAQKAAEGAECAGAQGRFWEMHGRLFEEPRRLTEPDLVAHARALGLDGKAFDACLGGRMVDKVRADASLAREHEVSATPTFFVGAVRSDGRVRVVQRLSGAQPPAAFEAALEKVLSAAGADRARQ